VSMLMRFLLSCSWIRITFSVPCVNGGGGERAYWGGWVGEQALGGGVCVNDDAVLAQLLLDQDHLLCALCMGVCM
jgi:hypothetical protein